MEGKPGTGKTFIIKTLHNINRIIHKSNLCDMASAPTGCASALIGGSTHYRTCRIPVGRKFIANPCSLNVTSTNELNALKRHNLCLKCRIFDEHSHWVGHNALNGHLPQSLR